METKAPKVKWESKTKLEKSTIFVNYLVAAVLIYFALIRILQGGVVFSLTRCPTCVFQLLVGLAFALMATSDLLDV